MIDCGVNTLMYMKYQKQVDKAHYSFGHYFDECRWMSYWYQTKEIVGRQDIKSILDVGPGTTMLENILKTHRPDVSYTTLDLAEDVKPDIFGSVTKIPLEDNSYDAVSAFQILEHIEFSDFETALSELKRVSRKYVFISLPHFGPSIEFWIKLPFFKRIKLSLKVPYPMKHVFGGQHYWEVGKNGYSAKKIRKIMSKHFDIVDEYVPFENQYHHFYILEIKK